MNKLFTVILSLVLSSCAGNYSEYSISNDSISEVQIDTDIYYVNDELGFKMQFPLEWEDYYNFVESDNGIAIMFYGQSDICKKYNEKGLLMFYIVNENVINTEPLDSIKKIGTAKGIDYYYATSTDVSLAPIMLIDDTLDSYIEKYGEEQVEIINQDWNKAQEMMEDIPNILHSFEELS